MSARTCSRGVAAAFPARQVQRVRRIDALLAEEYGVKVPPKGRRDPVAALVGTILSQNTNDANSSRAFASLVERFPRWEDVLAADDAEVADAIRPGGLANIKAPRIRRILSEIRDAHGSFDLGFLAQRLVEDSMAYLTGYTGVGAKTAACVVLFALALPAFPVDTHVLRTTERLRLVPEGATAEAAHRLLEKLVPDGLKYQLHLNLVAHGRARCRPTRPRCAGCPVRRLCGYVGQQPMGGRNRERAPGV